MTTWPSRRLKHLAALPIRNGLGERGEFDDPTWPRYIRTTDIAGPSLLRDDTFRSLPPDIASRALLKPGDLLMTAAGATIGKSYAFREHYPACFAGYLVRFRPSEQVDGRFVAYWMQSQRYWAQIDSGRVKSTIENFSASRYGELRLNLPPMNEQCAIADYLDTEVARIDALIAKKQSLLNLLGERIDTMVSSTIGKSALVEPAGTALEIRKLLSKRKRPGTAGHVVTAFRDGQVTARALRRAEGYTEAWTDNAAFQGVYRGDVVVHGLDGFAGAVGTAEVDGICSPAYHVMQPRDGGDPEFYGRLLRLLAVTGYLGLFAVSTRERAVDFRNWDLFGRIPIPQVPVEEQRQIGDRIRVLRPLRVAVERSAALARERRQAFITAAIAGELEIPGVAS